MKKLIAMIGAVATAFGLYAEEPATTPNSTATSFEALDVGVTESNTWSAATAGWTYPDAEEFTLGEQDADELEAAEVYGTGRQRRNDEFANKGTNNNFLKLETGNKVLSHEIDAGQVYVDQLVKFTGFEEAQTNIDGKVAVWMTAIEQEGTPAVPAVGEPKIQDGVDEDGNPIMVDNPDYVAPIAASSDYIAADTNLYVSVGDAAGKLVNVKLEGNYEPGKWYRLTIKSVGNVFATDAQKQLGFQIFINGAEAAIDDDYRSYNSNYEAFTKNAKNLYDAGQLFTAMGNFGALATVGYQGIGSVDDIIISEVAPDFDAAVAVTFAPPTGAEVTSVKDNKGNVYTYKGEAIKVAPGELEVTIVAAPGYFFYTKDGKKVYTLTETVTASADGELEVKLDDGESCVEAAVQVVNEAGTVTNLYSEAELAVELTGLKTGDTATVLKNCEIQDATENTLFSFTKNTTIAVPEANVWNVFIAKWVFDNKGTLEEKAGELYDNVGLFAGKTVNVTFDDPVDANKCTLYIEGAIAGNITAGDDNGVVVINNDGVETTLSGTITAANVDVADDVTFVGDAKIVSSATDLNDYIDNFLAEDGEVEVVGEGPWTAQIKGAPVTTGFAIIIAGDPAVTNYYPTLDAAIAAAGTVDEKLGQLPSVVTILENVNVDATATIAKEVAIDLNGNTMTFAEVLHAFSVLNGGDLTVANGTVIAPTTSSSFYVDYDGILELGDKVDGTTLTVNVTKGIAMYDGTTVGVNADVTINASNGFGVWFWDDGETYGTPSLEFAGKVVASGNAAIMGSGNDTLGCTVAIANGAWVECNDGVNEGIYMPGAGTLSIGAATVKGYTGVYVKAGATAVIDGATIIGTGAKKDYVPYGNGSKPTGDAFVVDNCGYPAGSTLNVSITGGTFDAQGGAAAVASYADTAKGYEPLAGFITGGKYRGDTALDPAIIADGYELGKPDEDGFYTVAQSSEPVATVDGVEYTDLHKALVDGSAAGSTVELIADVDLAGVAWEPIAGFAGVFDGKGHKISNTTKAIFATIAAAVKADEKNGIVVNTPIIRNVIIENVNINEGVEIASADDVKYVGGFINGDLAMNDAVISNITVTGLIKVNGGKYVGGVIGHKGYAKTTDLRVIGDEGSFIGCAKASQVGGVIGSSGEGGYSIVNSSASGVTIVASKQAGGIQGRFFEGNRIVGCSTENVTLQVGSAPFGAIAGHAQNDGSIRYLINYTTDDTVNPILGYSDDYPIFDTVIGTGFEGDFGSFTAGTFTADDAALADVAKNCAEGYEAVENQDGTYTILPKPVAKVNGVEYRGTLAQALEAGKAAGSVVELIADVDLAGKNWEPVINFNGTFDGKGYTISNLSITKEENVTTGVGLIGSRGASSLIRNLTVSNVTVTAISSEYVGAVIGRGEANQSTVCSNVTVCGSIKIDGKKRVGGIAGYFGYAPFADCRVIGDGAETSFIKSRSSQVGGLYGTGCTGINATPPGSERYISYNCSVSDITIHACSGGEAGGLSGRGFRYSSFKDCAVANIVLVSENDADNWAGAISGRRYLQEGSARYIMDCSVDNVTFGGVDAPLFGGASDGTTIIGTNVNGDNLKPYSTGSLKLTSGNFTLDTVEAMLPLLQNELANGYKLILNEQDDTYSIEEIKVTSITLNEMEKTLAPEETLELTATVEPADALNKDIAWTTSDDAVATVSDAGVVTAVAEGTATITATNEKSGVYATCTVTVKAAGPTPAPGNDSKVDPVPGEPNTYTVTPTEGNTTGAIVISGAKSGDTFVVGDAAVTSVTVEDAAGVTFKVMSGSYDITAACAGLSGNTFSAELDATKKVEVGTEQIAVEPELATTDVEGEKIEPMVVDASTVTLNVKTIPGLKYQLIKKTTLADTDWVAASEILSADAAREGLQAAKTTDPSSFYKVKVSK